MEDISVFDVLKIGVGPSSSHTLGPWRAAERFLRELKEKNISLSCVRRISVELYGSLSLTGKGHATDLAVMLGLSGADPERFPIDKIPSLISDIKRDKKLALNGECVIVFDMAQDVIFKKEFLPFHPNGLIFTAFFEQGDAPYSSAIYSIGGGFLTKEHEAPSKERAQAFPFPVEKASDVLGHCKKENKRISDVVYANELSIRSKEDVDKALLHIWQTMLECVYAGCHTEGVLPGGLQVRRRAYDMHRHLKRGLAYRDAPSWIKSISENDFDFRDIIKWVSCFALAVNEVNASLGRVVTAPTNGSAGVIPSVLAYYIAFIKRDVNEEDIKRFLLVAAQIGVIFKKGATISAAMGGCQAEIGVSSAMSAGALCERMGGTPEQCFVAAEIAMEHHLGLTCDPIAGLVQVPCIERNTMGAIKAINAVELALETDPRNIKVPMDKIVSTMWETAKDMNSKYKETSEGGLALAVNISDC